MHCIRQNNCENKRLFSGIMLLILPKYTRINSCQFIVGKRTENVGFGLNAYDLRPVSTQENKHRIGLDFFPSCIIHTAGPKNVENTSTLYHPGCGSQVQTGQKIGTESPICAGSILSSDPMLIFLSGNRPLCSIYVHTVSDNFMYEHF